MKKLFFSVILLSSLAALAQQDAQFSHYAFNQLYLNPAYAGIRGAVEQKGTRFTLIHRSQWLGYAPTLIDQGGSPTTEILSTDMYSSNMQGGLGLTILTDQIALQRYTSAQLSLSKHFDIGKGKLSVGLQGSYAANSFRPGWRPPDEGTLTTDPSIPNVRDANGNVIVDGNGNPTGTYKQGFMDAAAGLWYQTLDYYVGVGLNRLLDNKYDFNNITSTGGYRKHMYISAGYKIKSVYNWEFMPTLLIKSSMSKKGTQFDLGGIATFKSDMWGGLNFRQGDSFGILLGKSFKTSSDSKEKQLKLGYALDLTVKGAKAKSLTSHEIMLTYQLPRNIDNLPPPIHTPRFQY